MVEVQQKKFDSNFWLYQPGFGEQFREKVQKRVQQKGNQLKASDFNDMDLIHPGRHTGIDSFFSDHQIPQSSKILQIGSGLGGTSRYLQTTRGVNITSVEYLPHFVQESTYLNSVLGLQDHITHHQGDIRSFPLPENEYDAAYAILCFMHITGDEGIQNVVKALKPGGLFYLQEYYWIKTPQEFNQTDNWCVETRGMYGVRSKQNYREAYDAAGLEIIEEKEFGKEYTEAVWNRAQSLVDAGCPVDNTHGSPHSQYVVMSPYLSRSFDGMTADEIREKWPGVAPFCDPDTVVYGQKKLCDIWRVIARKREQE